MAGGVGSRFWPLSKSAKPKQFIDILGVGRTLLQQTFDRFKNICPNENIFIVTSDKYTEIVKQQLPEINFENILSEPARRNTAPCIAYAVYKIKHKNPLANIVVSPSDHLVTYVEEFQRVISKSLDFTEKNNALLTIGIKPTRPETGYGYIQMNEGTENNNDDIFRVKTFTEKPDLEMAEFFLSSGEFLWNSGIFIWSLKSIGEAMQRHLPDVMSLFNNESVYYTDKEKSFIEDVYKKVKNISIDYGVMEKAENVYVLPADFGWSDLGTWGSLYENSEKNEDNNVVVGDNVMLYSTRNSIIHMPKDKLVVIHGLENAIVAESDGFLLISTLNKEDLIRQFVTDIQVEKGEGFV